MSGGKATGPAIGRRGFIISAGVVGGGMLLTGRQLFGIGTDGFQADGPSGNELSPWIEIAANGIVTVRVPQPEIGNGASTQAAMTICEELPCDWANVRVEPASIQRSVLEDNVYAVGFQPFFGGHSTAPDRMRHLLQLGASARERLKAAAAARWGVAASDVSAKAGILTHAATARSLKFGEVASEAALIKLATEPKPKPRDQWTLLGKASPGKLDIPAIVQGKAIYGIDVKLPGMLHAALMQSPVHGGRLKSLDKSAALNMPGVKAVIEIDPAKTPGSPVKDASTFGMQDSLAQHGVAVVAEQYWQARSALEALNVRWDAGEGGRWQSDAQIYEAARARFGASDNTVLASKGDPATQTGKLVEADYGTPYCENAAMEPLNATVLVNDDSAEIWCPTQDQQQAFWVAVDETGLSPERVRVCPTLAGGGFGRRTQSDDIRMAVAVARQVPGSPVKVIWSREECFAQGRYRTPIVSRYKAKLDEATGMPKALEADAVYVGTAPAFQLPLGFFDQPYFQEEAIPHLRLATAKLPLHILNGAWRAPCYNSHVFMLESFIDECAHAAGHDPLSYRLKLLAHWDKSWRDCLEVVARKAGWGKPLPKGEGIGIAISCWPMASKRENGSVVATAARVNVTRDGVLSVRQIDVAFDCGSFAHRDAVRAQIEGATLFGLNAVLNEQLTVSDGAIVERNFDAYPMARMADVPSVNVHFDALSGHERMAIIGEAPTGPIQPAIANAVYAAIGKRIRTTPLRTQDLSWS